ncbi:hypothetical protein NHP214376_13220 [Helicobacter ailurogastricus]|nr:hypothetical protein NHP214376_13220 [Helicobacter ailurogastricus]GLH60003.1 hypothetical protein NHP214377_12740 [Helicobacter ailurogastricus]
MRVGIKILLNVFFSLVVLGILVILLTDYKQHVLVQELIHITEQDIIKKKKKPCETCLA